jgi:hypothetical protein
LIKCRALTLPLTIAGKPGGGLRFYVAVVAFVFVDLGNPRSDEDILESHAEAIEPGALRFQSKLAYVAFLI